MKYKVGDKVKLRNDLKYDGEYGEAYYIAEMDKYLGKELEIERVYEIGETYDFKCDGEKQPFSLTDEMIENATLRLIDVLIMISKGEFKEGWQVKLKDTGEIFTFKNEDGDLFDLCNSYGEAMFEVKYVTAVRDEVEIIKPEGEKEISQEIDELRVDLVDSVGNISLECVYAIVNKINELIYRFNAEVINNAK